jgi:hypothetical protein
LFLVPLEAPTSPPRVATLAPATAVVGGDAHWLWLIRTHIFPDPGVQVQLLNADDLTAGPPLSFPGTASLYTATPTGMCVVSQDPSATQAAILTNVATP